MNEPAIKPSEDGVKILRWLAKRVDGNAEKADRALFATGNSAKAYSELRTLRANGLVELLEDAYYRITPAGRDFISAHYPEWTT